MDKQRNALKAGGFIVVCLALILALIVAIKGADRLIEPMQVRQVQFKLTDDVGGLRVGDDVRVGGFKVGVIRGILITPDAAASQDCIRVTFALPRKYALHKNAHVAIQNTLTGISWLNFESLGQGEPLPPDEPLTGHPSRSNEIMSVVASLAPEIKATLDEIRSQTIPAAHSTLARFSAAADAGTSLLQAAKSHVDPVAGKYHQLADRAIEMMTQVRDVLGDSKGDLRSTAANLRQATATLKDKLPLTLDHVNDVLVKMDAAVGGIHATLKDVQATMGNAREMSAAARSVLVGNRGKLDGMIAALKTTADNLKGASVEIRRSPWRLLYKPAPNEMGNLNLYDSARHFAEGAGDLSDASTALRDALHNPQIDKAELQKLIDRVEQSFTQFHTVEEKLWKIVKE